MVEWKEVDMVTALVVIGNGTEIGSHRLVGRDLEHDSVILLKKTVDSFNRKWHYNNSLIFVICKRSLSHNFTSCRREFVTDRFTSVVPLIKERTSIEGK
jgi:hypothetical protein